MLKKISIMLFTVLLISSCSGTPNSDFGAGLWLKGKGTMGALESQGNTVYFPFDSSTLTADAMRTLDAQAQWWSDKADNCKIIIEGHCDDRGTREYNLGLGERRANAVKRYLISKGLPADKIDVVSYGKERPQVLGTGEEAWSKNRRAVTTK